MASTFSYLTESELANALSASGHIDTVVQNQIIAQLSAEGAFNPTVLLQQTSSDAVTPAVDVFQTSALSVSVDSDTDPALRAVVSDVGAGTHVDLNVFGSEDVLVALGNADYTAILNG